MALQIKPHTVTVTPVSQSAGADSVVNNPLGGSTSAAIHCLVVPMKPIEAFHRYGVMLNNAATIYIEIADAGSFAASSRIAYGGSTYWQQGDVELHQNGDDADCALVYMTGLQYPVIT